MQALRSSQCYIHAHLPPRLAFFVGSAHSQILSSQALCVGDPQTDLRFSGTSCNIPAGHTEFCLSNAKNLSSSGRRRTDFCSQDLQRVALVVNSPLLSIATCNGINVLIFFLGDEHLLEGSSACAGTAEVCPDSQRPVCPRGTSSSHKSQPEQGLPVHLAQPKFL